MSERERYTIIAIGGVLSLGVTATVCWAAVQSLASGDGGLQNLLFGGLLGAGAFGGGALFALLGVGHRTTATGSATVTIPQPPPDPPITVETGTPRRD